MTCPYMPCFSSTGSSLRNGPKSRRLRCGGAQRADEVVGLEGRGQKAKVDESIVCFVVIIDQDISCRKGEP